MHIAIDVKGAIQPGDFEHAAHRRLQGRQPEGAGATADALKAPYQHGQTGTINKFDRLEVDDKSAVIFRQQPVKYLA
jgi:hypothetical protein